MAFIFTPHCHRKVNLRGVSPSILKLFFSTNVIRRDHFVDRVKKFVFGEGAPPEEIEETMDSYYDLTKGEEPSVYSMDAQEIVDRLESIVAETLPQEINNHGKWDKQSVADIVLRYKVLNRCYKDFGLLVPNYQLNHMNSIQDVIKFYTSAKPKDTRTFKSIDMDNLPPNLNIGGKVPWKNVSS
ncbi:uncharacterized protein [Montipora capricornis]|uniref:uncharacterized protein isoform X1 n=2 Tax=Montipora capricornis TaxID=246305 RepID=UPI0035F198A7